MYFPGGAGVPRAETLRVADLVINTASRTLTRTVNLTEKEYLLLKLLMLHSRPRGEGGIDCTIRTTRLAWERRSLVQRG